MNTVCVGCFMNTVCVGCFMNKECVGCFIKKACVLDRVKIEKVENVNLLQMATYKGYKNKAIWKVL